MAAVVLYLVTIWIPLYQHRYDDRHHAPAHTTGQGRGDKPGEHLRQQVPPLHGRIPHHDGSDDPADPDRLRIPLHPGIVLSLAWSLSYYFLIEKGKNPMEAIKASNDATYGSKWTMFFVMLVFCIVFGVTFGILGAVCSLIDVGVHHLPGHVRARRAGHLHRHGHRSLDLETVEGQRGVEIPSPCNRKTALRVVFLLHEIKNYRKTINIICFSESNSYICPRNRRTTPNMQNKKNTPATPAGHLHHVFHRAGGEHRAQRPDRLHAGSRRGVELGEDIAEKWSSGTPRMIYMLDNIRITETPDDAIRIAPATPGAEVRAEVKRLGLVVEEPAPGASPFRWRSARSAAADGFTRWCCSDRSSTP